MFHLFNRVYMDYESWYSSKYEYVLAYEKQGKHPLVRQTDFPFEEIPAFGDYLAEKHGGLEDNFWNDLIKKNKKFLIYADQEFYEKVQMRYWKSIFENLSAKDAYQLHKFHYLDQKLKKFLIDTGDRSRGEEEYRLLTEEEFTQKYESLPVIGPIEKMTKANVSFEYLLADYFFDPKSVYAASFKTRLKNLCWKIWFNDIEILRSELINSFYDIKKIIPEAKFSFENVTSVEHFILSEPKLRWILDPDFNEGNIDYVKDHYGVELFTDLASTFRESWDLKIKSADPEILSKIEIQDHILPTKQVFEGQYLELLEQNIQKGFGCRFVDEYLRDKANQLLPCFVYDKVREGKTGELKFLKLKRGSH